MYLTIKLFQGFQLIHGKMTFPDGRIQEIKSTSTWRLFMMFIQFHKKSVTHIPCIAN